VPAACTATIAVTGRDAPDPEAGRVYADLYPQYRSLYPALKPSFADLSRANPS
jgi:sugar (pentulose or hexulose) kinase